MSFKLGLVGLCTSHPEAWVPVIRKLTEEKIVDVEVVAAWDSGETRPAGFAKEFCKKMSIAKAVDKMEDLLDLVDGVIVHTTNWDKHVEQARPFVEAGKSVLIDKPMAGNMQDINQLLDWAKQKKRVTGGSSLRFAYEVQEFLKEPVAERGEVHTAFAGCGVDDFNYGIHAYALICGLMGVGVKSVQYMVSTRQKHIRINWKNGTAGIICVGTVDAWLPFYATAVTTKKVVSITTDNSRIYRSLLEAELPYLTGKVENPPIAMNDLVEPELAALAAKSSWLNGGGEVFLSDLGLKSPSYDGKEFAIEYRRARMG